MTTMTKEFTNRPRVYITRQIPQEGLDLLLGRCNVSYWDSNEPAPRAELLFNVPGCSVLVCMPTDKIDRDVLIAAGPALKIVATMSEDTNHIETSECSRRNIRVLTLPKVEINFVAHMAFALLRFMTLNWMTSFMQNLNAVLESKDIVASTKKDQAYCLELSNRTVGIIGMESLGQSVAMILRNLGVTEILYYELEVVHRATDPDINAKFVGQSEILTRSDIIFVCSGQENDKDDLVYFDKDAFNKMKPSALLIDATKKFPGNFGDLYEALRSGKIAAAGLDVREYDDIPNRHPLDMLENCYYLPYRECYKWDGRKTCAQQLAGAILMTLQEIDFSQEKTKPMKCGKNDLEQIPEVPV